MEEIGLCIHDMAYNNSLIFGGAYLGLNLIRRIEKTRVTSIAQFLLHGNTVQPESYTTQKKNSSLCILIIMIIMSGEATQCSHRRIDDNRVPATTRIYRAK